MKTELKLLENSQYAFMVLRGKKHGNIFWTKGGNYRTDWYELLFESDNEEEVREYWRRKIYGRENIIQNNNQ